MTLDIGKLDFAYKYPFSEEAKELITSLNSNSVEEKYLTAGLLRVNEALSKSKIEFVRTPLTELKYTYLMSYVYARMLVSASGDRLAISTYVSAEAARSEGALSQDSTESFAKVAGELRLNLREHEGEFLMDLAEFVSIDNKSEEMRLANQQVEKGTVAVTRSQAVKLLGLMIEKRIRERLPIERRELPREIIDAAKGIKAQERRVALDSGKGTYAWIEKLLTTPIADVRHRTVNLILSPYLVNVRKLDEESAARIIIDYIEKCKKISPATKINDSYIRYQCKYAKARGMRPLSLTRARELLSDVVDFG